MLGAACTSGTDETLPEPETGETVEKLLIVTTTPLLADLAANLVSEDVGRVETLVDREEDPRSAELTSKDLQLIDQADLVVAIGSGFEPFAKTLAGLEEDNVAVLDLGPELGDDDAIIWTDPGLMAKGVQLIAQKLAEIDTRLATDEAADHADAYADSLLELDRTMADRFAGLTEDQREFATGQDVLGHLAKRYDLKVIASLFEAGAPVNPAEVASDMAESSARLLVVDDTFPVVPDPAPFAEGFGLKPLALPILTLGPPSSETGTYLGAMNALSRDLTEALAAP